MAPLPCVMVVRMAAAFRLVFTRSGALPLPVASPPWQPAQVSANRAAPSAPPTSVAVVAGSMMLVSPFSLPPHPSAASATMKMMMGNMILVVARICTDPPSSYLELQHVCAAISSIHIPEGHALESTYLRCRSERLSERTGAGISREKADSLRSGQRKFRKRKGLSAKTKCRRDKKFQQKTPKVAATLAVTGEKERFSTSTSINPAFKAKPTVLTEQTSSISANRENAPR